MHVYGELKGRLTAGETIRGRLTAGGTIRGTLTVPTSAITDIYDGDYIVVPKAHSEQILETAQKLVLEDITVTKIPYHETSNLFDGKTVFIAEDINYGN